MNEQTFYITNSVNKFQWIVGFQKTTQCQNDTDSKYNTEDFVKAFSKPAMSTCWTIQHLLVWCYAEELVVFSYHYSVCHHASVIGTECLSPLIIVWTNIGQFWPGNPLICSVLSTNIKICDVYSFCNRKKTVFEGKNCHDMHILLPRTLSMWFSLYQSTIYIDLCSPHRLTTLGKTKLCIKQKCCTFTANNPQ